MKNFTINQITNAPLYELCSLLEEHKYETTLLNNKCIISSNKNCCIIHVKKEIINPNNIQDIYSNIVYINTIVKIKKLTNLNDVKNIDEKLPLLYNKTSIDLKINSKYGIEFKTEYFKVEIIFINYEYFNTNKDTKNLIYIIEKIYSILKCCENIKHLK